MSTTTKKEEFGLFDVAMGIPADVGYMVYMIMFYEGVGNLFPWNAFITASNYYGERFCGTSFESNFENFFSLTYTLSQTIGLAFSVIYQNKLSLRTKIIYPLICYSVVFLINTILVGVQDIDPTLLFWITLISACLCGCFGAVLSGGLFGLAAMFPATYTSALMNGQGVAGLTVAVSGLLTSLATSAVDTCSDDDGADDGDCEQTMDYSALAYFIIATLILVSCGFAFLSLNNLTFAKYYINKAESNEPEVSTHGITSPLMDGASEHSEGYMTNHVGADNNKNNDTTNTTSTVDAITTNNEITTTTTNENETVMGGLSYAKLSSVYRQIMIPSLSVWGVFAVTIGIFPSLIVLLESEQKCHNDIRFYNDLYVPFFFLLFNLFDLMGRVSAGAIKPLFTAKNIWIPSMLRIVFFPLFLLCNVSDSLLPVVFKSDAFPIIFMILMAYSNGYIASLSMMIGASAVSPKDAQIAGTIMVFSLTLGLFTGACLSFVTVLISQGRV